jgi:hypothetical protein
MFAAVTKAIWMSQLGHALSNIVHDDIPPLGDALASVEGST